MRLIIFFFLISPQIHAQDVWVKSNCMTEIMNGDTITRSVDTEIYFNGDQLILNQYGTEKLYAIISDTAIIIDGTDLRAYSTISIDGFSAFYIAVDVYAYAAVQYSICSQCGAMVERIYKTCE